MIISNEMDVALNQYEISKSDKESKYEYVCRKRNEQIKMIEKLLETNEFNMLRQKTGGGAVNRFYVKEKVDTVLCIIDRTEMYQKEPALDRNLYYCFVDKEFYDEFILPRECKINVDGITANDKAEGTANIITYGDIYQNEKDEKEQEVNGIERALSYFVCLKDYYNINGGIYPEGEEIDHITHNRFINLKEYLRPCSTLKNNINKSNRKLAIADDKKLTFRIMIKTISEDKTGKTNIREDLLEKGYKEKWKSLYCTDKINSEEELYKKIGKVEKEIYEEFRYDPLKDFSETWYVLVYEKMLGKISHEEVEEYQRDYFKRTYPDIAKYYALLWN